MQFIQGKNRTQSILFPQSIVEHPYGTIKRQWVLTTSLPKKVWKSQCRCWLNIYSIQTAPSLMNITVKTVFTKFLRAFAPLFSLIKVSIHWFIVVIRQSVFKKHCILILISAARNQTPLIFIWNATGSSWTNWR